MTWSAPGEGALLFAVETLDGAAPACQSGTLKCLGSIGSIEIDPDGLGFTGKVGFQDGQTASCRFVKVGGGWPDCGGCSGSADRCTAGVCRCGDLAPCAGGQACKDAWCGCKVACDDGCCSGTQCLAGTQVGACGSNGEPCQDCAAKGEVCETGNCGDACPEGFKTGGWCVYRCTRENCPDGCCNTNEECIREYTLDVCGITGDRCRACNNGTSQFKPKADHCNEKGWCVCGPRDETCTSFQICTKSECI